MWDRAFIEKAAREAIRPDDRPGVADALYWWSTNQEEVAT